MAGDKDKDKDDNGLSGEDRRLWDFVARSIKPLDKAGKPSASRAAPPAKVKETAPQPGEAHRLAWKMPDFGLKPPAAENGAARGGVDRRMADRLRRGAFPLDGRLDLHGLRQGEAQDRLTQFLLESWDSGRRCVLVITGKGRRFFKEDGQEQDAGVLRRLLPVWLGMAPLAPLVLLHCKAQPKDGGDGAFYILLRRRR